MAHTTTFSHHRSRVLPGAVTTQLRSKPSMHSHRGTHPAPCHDRTNRGNAEQLAGRHPNPKGYLGLRCQGDLYHPPPPSGRGCYASTGRGHTILNWLTREDYTIPPQQLHVPSYHPYNHSQQPRRIDYLATKHITAGEGKVLPIKDRAASDHDAITTPVGTHKRGGPARTTWGRDVYDQRAKSRSSLPYHPLGGRPSPSDSSHCQSYYPTWGREQQVPREPAPQNNSGTQRSIPQWGQQQDRPGNSSPGHANKEHTSWMRQQAKRAANLDWRAMRSLQTHNTHRGWHLQLQDDPQWQDRLGEHMQNSLCQTPAPGGIAYMTTLKKQLRRRCKHKTWAPFSTKNYSAHQTLGHTTAAPAQTGYRMKQPKHY